MIKFKDGDFCITVGRFGQKCAGIKSGGQHFSIPIWTIKTYVAKTNYKGELKWFLAYMDEKTIASKQMPNSLVNKIKNEKNYIPGVTQYMKV